MNLINPKNINDNNNNEDYYYYYYYWMLNLHSSNGNISSLNISISNKYPWLSANWSADIGDSTIQAQA